MFECTKCGDCCRNIDKVPELINFHNGNGVCIYLRDDNLCSIYDNRPDICNVEKMYQVKYKYVMSLQEYEKINMEGCKKIQINNNNY